MAKEVTSLSQSSTKPKKTDKKADSKKSAAAAKAKNPKKFGKFFKDLKAEWKKIVWPTKKQVGNNTGVVLLAMAVSGLFIWGIDSGLKVAFDLILQRK